MFRLKKILVLPVLTVLVLAGCVSVECKDQRSQEFQISKADLMDKIKGGWAGQVIGVCYALPTEFKYQKRIIPDSIQMNLTGEYIKKHFNNDDIYVDAKFVEVIGRSGFDAPAELFGLAFANAEFHLWGANQRARYNILQGTMPPESGHWKNTTASGQIDFQIEADFAGLTTAGGSLDATVDIADRVGHIMNYGDGWYSGVFVASMYSLAFIYDDVEVIINESLKLIPEESGFHKAISDVISMHKQYPDDWKTAWHEIEKRDWSYTLHYPFGVYRAFSMDANLNMAYVVVGLLYGQGDFFNSMDISMRCGQDSDCNASSVGGVLGTILGYDKIPEAMLAAYKDIEDVTLNYTSVSLNDCYDICYKSSLDNIVKAGGKVDGDIITINYKSHDALPLEVAYPNIYPTDNIAVSNHIQQVGRIDFSGTGIAIMGGPNFRKLGRKDHKLQDYVAKVEVTIDGKKAAIRNLPFSYHARTDVEIYFNFELPKGQHYIELKWLNPIDGAELYVRNYITYSDKIVRKEIKPRDPRKLKFPHPDKIEKKVIESRGKMNISQAVKKFAPGWKVENCGKDMKPGLRAEWRGRKKVLLTHPLNKKTSCVLSRTIDVPAKKKTQLFLSVGHHHKGDWVLVIKVDDKQIFTKEIGKETCKDGWADLTLDLSEYAGKSISLKLENKADEWKNEAAYWDKIIIKSE